MSLLDFTHDIFNALGRVIPDNSTFVALHEPSFDTDDAKSVSECVKSSWVSYQGEAVKNFEKVLLQYLGASDVILTSSGTSALYVSLKALGVGPGDEVLLPSLTFAATAAAVVQTGAVPHFFDSSLEDMGPDIQKLEEYLERSSTISSDGKLINSETQRPIKCVIPVYVLGTPFALRPLQELCYRYNLQIVEDAAEALGSLYENKPIAAQSGIGILSFNGNKIITTGGGGAVVTNSIKLGERIRHLVTTAKKPHKYEFEHDDFGYNYRMPALNAALGASQMRNLSVFLDWKRKLHKKYLDAFNNNSAGEIFSPSTTGVSNYWLNAFILHSDLAIHKNAIIDKLLANNIGVRPLWKPLHTQKIYANFPRMDCSQAMKIYERTICLPSSAYLGS